MSPPVDLDYEPPPISRVWILHAGCAATCFCFANEITSIITFHVDGLSTIFYLSGGAMVAGISHQVIMSVLNFRDPAKDYIWHRNNLIIDGKLRIPNLLLFIIMCSTYFCIVVSIFMTMKCAHMSGVNVGVITTMWSVQPLIAAVLDFVLYRQLLSINHIIGIVLVIIGAVSVGFSGIYKIAARDQALMLMPNHIPEKSNSDDGLIF